MYLYSQQQQRVAFIDFQRAVITDLDGYTIAFLASDAVFVRTGKHVAWWMGSYLSDLQGRVLLVAAEAFVPGLALPRPARSPHRRLSDHFYGRDCT
jgi:aminoglycoside/choline kinase family phosphotransferase